MKTSTSILKELLIDDLPPGFVRSLFERIRGIYPDSHSHMINDPNLGEDQAYYALGYYRRALAETILMRKAAEHGLKVEVIKPENGGCKCVYVASQRFGFTMCHVPNAGAFPQTSDTREQSSKINEHIAQADLFPIESTPRKELYGIFVHTEQPGQKDSFQSLHIGFPDHNFVDWIGEPIDVQDIVDIQERIFQEKEDLHAQIQNPNPVLKEQNVNKGAKEE